MSSPRYLFQRLSRCRLAALAWLCLLAFTAQAQGWPRQALRMVVAHPAGSPADQLARALAAPLEAALGQAIQVENFAATFPALASNDAAAQVAQAANDGYTVLLASHGVQTVNPFLYKALPLAPARELTPAVALARIPARLLISTEWGVDSVRDLLARMKEQPAPWVYASVGLGSTDWLAAELFKQKAGVFAVHLPFKEAASAQAALLDGQADFWFDTGTARQAIKDGRLKELALNGDSVPATPRGRASSPSSAPKPLQDGPATDSAVETVYGVFAPAGTPPNVVTRINREINRILETAAMKQLAASLGARTLPLSVTEFGQRIDADAKRNSALIKNLGVRAD